jgi:translocator protein
MIAPMPHGHTSSMADHPVQQHGLDRRPSARAAGALALFIVLALAAGGVGVLLQGNALDTNGWYDGLSKPGFTPPSAVFGPVWTLLYLTIGVAGWLLWRARSAERGTTLGLWGLQLVLNAFWTGAFFGLRSPWLGLAVILALLATIVLLVIRSRSVDRRVSLLLLPYLAWVGFATALNVAIVYLN